MRIFGREVTLRSIPWRFVLILLAAAVVGAGATIAAVEFNKHTSTDQFCTSCHNHSDPTDAHARPPTDPHYLQSAHVSNSAGVKPSCGQCHIPMNNFFVETFTHITSGIRDVFAEMTTNFDDREAWAERRRQLAKGVHEHMRRQGNVTCISCHAPASIKPASQVGQVIHASLPKDLACVGCHRNLVHSRPGSQTAADEIAAIKRAMNDSVHSSHLANYHLQKGMTCSTCHGNDLIPDANATAINAQCATCHGGMEQVAARHKGPSYLNPHASHLGNIACGSCHFAHEESKAYCLNCHTNFNMPMRGRAAAATPAGGAAPAAKASKP
jgi:nitrate/TMAO reductase-like tetraheme cytochrome c subunit